MRRSDLECYQIHRFEAREEAANIQAAEQLGKLHDHLKAAGYEGHPLEVLLVRLLFCLLADDTGIFEKNQCKEYLEQRTAEDGSDFGMHLAQLFEVLDTAVPRRAVYSSHRAVPPGEPSRFCPPLSPDLRSVNSDERR